MSKPLCARKTPCASCPYRKNVPSGVWEEGEYDKLPPYDEETFNQPTSPFLCHQQDGTLCSGWLGYGDPTELLAVRLGILTGVIDPSAATYTTTVPLFPSGTAAAEHGKQEIETPGERAARAIVKLNRSRDMREPLGDPHQD